MVTFQVGNNSRLPGWVVNVPVTDAAVLARSTAGALVVVGARVVRRGELDAALNTLDQVDARVLGLVLNKVQLDDEALYGYGYRYDARRAKAVPSETPVVSAA